MNLESVHNGLVSSLGIEEWDRTGLVVSNGKMYSDDNRPTEEELEQMKSKLLIELDKLL